MNIFNKNLILAVAGAVIVFATGCTHKASRPTPDQTLITGSGSGYDTSTVQTTDTSHSQAGAWTPAPTENYGVVTNTSQGDVFPSGQNEGTRIGDEIRNIPELQPIYFGFDRSAIEQKERAKFQAVKDYLAKNPAYKIVFEGHCDWRGTAEYNMALGDRRANASKKYATSVGIDPSRLSVRSLGSTQAVERGSDDVMAKDRRAEIVVLVK